MSAITNNDIVASNVTTIAEAKVIGLLVWHPRDPRYAIQSIFTATLIKDTYKPQDVILVEDSAAKAKEDLLKSQTYSLDLTNYQLEGWDDPSVYCQADEFKQLRRNINEAIKTKDEKTLRTFAAKFPESAQMQSNSLEYLLLWCQNQIAQMEIDLTRKTMQQRNESLKQRITHHLSREGKIYACMGPWHADKNWMDSLKIPYMILEKKS